MHMPPSASLLYPYLIFIRRPSVINQNIQASVAAKRPLDDIFPLRLFRDVHPVAGHAGRELCRDHLRAGDVDVADEDFCAFPGEAEGDCCAEPRARSWWWC